VHGTLDIIDSVTYSAVQDDCTQVLTGIQLNMLHEQFLVLYRCPLIENNANNWATICKTVSLCYQTVVSLSCPVCPACL